MEHPHYFRYITYTLVSTLVVLFYGCMGKSQPSRFYALSPINAPAETKTEASVEPRTVIELSTVDIPDYLNRPQLVTRNGQNELNVAEYDRWAGSFNSDIVTVLAENLSTLLSRDGIAVVSADWNIPLNYRLAVDIRRFDIMPNDTLLLKAEWTLAGNHDKTAHLLREVSFSEPINGTDYPARVAAMSRTMERLSREMASTIRYEIQKQKNVTR
jgi:uncharacterized protein